MYFRVRFGDIVVYIWSGLMVGAFDLTYLLFIFYFFVVSILVSCCFGFGFLF